MALHGFVVPLQGQEWIAEVILSVALLDKSISVLSLSDLHKHSCINLLFCCIYNDKKSILFYSHI